MRSVAVGFLLFVVALPAVAQPVWVGPGYGTISPGEIREPFGTISHTELSTGTTTRYATEISASGPFSILAYEAEVGSVGDPCGGFPCYGDLEYYAYLWDLSLGPVEGPNPRAPDSEILLDASRVSVVFSGGFFEAGSQAVQFPTSILSIDFTGLAFGCPSSSCLWGVRSEGVGQLEGVLEFRDAPAALAVGFDDDYSVDETRGVRRFPPAAVRTQIEVASPSPVPALGAGGLLALGGGLLGAGSITLRNRGGKA